MSIQFDSVEPGLDFCMNRLKNDVVSAKKYNFVNLVNKKITSQRYFTFVSVIGG